jgi:hypothetical protein
MKIPIEVKRLATLWTLIVLEIGVRSVYYVVNDSRIVWKSSKYIPDEVFIAWPKWMYALRYRSLTF